MNLHMDHLPFVAGAYGLFLIVALFLSIGAATRLRGATAKLRAVDPRTSQGGRT